MDTSTPGRKGTLSPRRVAFSIVAGLIGLLTGVVGMAIYLDANSTERMVHRLHDIGPALMLLLIFAGACVALVATAGRIVAPMQQLMAGVVALATATVMSGRRDPAVGVLIVLILALAALHPARAELLKAGQRPSRLLGAMALAGAIPLTWFALDQAALQRSSVVADAHGTEAHYAGMAATALVFAVVALVASLRTTGWRVPAWTAAMGVGLFGLASFSTPRLPGSFGPAGAVVAMVGAVAFLVVVEFEARANRGQSLPAGAARAQLPDRVT